MIPQVSPEPGLAFVMLAEPGAVQLTFEATHWLRPPAALTALVVGWLQQRAGAATRIRQAKENEEEKSKKSERERENKARREAILR